ncbi:hypothetical protein [Pseudoclavibacter helvolus]|uniref:hypothetical protein n=1 Tax=Pseudoclavibacter helvolus TaxID=255205 RepID=UPI000837B3AB|nr:hypothetical protein [Pseudoclavibacter helvolus]
MEPSLVIALLSLGVGIVGAAAAVWAGVEARHANLIARSVADRERRTQLRAVLVPAGEHSSTLLRVTGEGYALSKGMDGPLEAARQVVATQQDVYLDGAATERLGNLEAALGRTLNLFHAARYLQDTSGKMRPVTYEPDAGSIAEKHKASVTQALENAQQSKALYEEELTLLVPAIEEELAALTDEDRPPTPKRRRTKRRRPRAN